MSVQYYRYYDLDGRTYGIVYEDCSNNFGAVLALRDDGELEPKVSTLKYRELPTPNQRLWCWLPASTAFAITEDLHPLAGLTLPPLAVTSVPEAKNFS